MRVPQQVRLFRLDKFEASRFFVRSDGCYVGLCWLLATILNRRVSSFAGAPGVASMVAASVASTRATEMAIGTALG